MTDRPARFQDAIIEGFILQGDEAGGPNHWSIEVVNAIVDMPLDMSWPFVLELIDRAPDRHLPDIAAGPLKDFLGRHGEHAIVAVESRAHDDPRFRRALRGVWHPFHMSDEIYARVVAASRPDEATDEEPRIRERAGA